MPYQKKSELLMNVDLNNELMPIPSFNENAPALENYRQLKDPALRCQALIKHHEGKMFCPLIGSDQSVKASSLALKPLLDVTGFNRSHQIVGSPQSSGDIRSLLMPSLLTVKRTTNANQAPMAKFLFNSGLSSCLPHSTTKLEEKANMKSTPGLELDSQGNSSLNHLEICRSNLAPNCFNFNIMTNIKPEKIPINAPFYKLLDVNDSLNELVEEATPRIN